MSLWVPYLPSMKTGTGSDTGSQRPGEQVSPLLDYGFSLAGLC